MVIQASTRWLTQGAFQDWNAEQPRQQQVPIVPVTTLLWCPFPVNKQGPWEQGKLLQLAQLDSPWLFWLPWAKGLIFVPQTTIRKLALKYKLKQLILATPSTTTLNSGLQAEMAEFRAFWALLLRHQLHLPVILIPCWHNLSIISQFILPKVTFTRKLSWNDSTNTGHKYPCYVFFNTSTIMQLCNYNWLWLTVNLLVHYKILPAKCLNIRISFRRRDFKNSGSDPTPLIRCLPCLTTLQTQCPAPPAIGKSFIKHQGLIQTLHTKHNHNLIAWSVLWLLSRPEEPCWCCGWNC